MRGILIAVSMLALAMAQVKAQTNTEMRKMATKEHNEAVKLYSKEKASKDAAKRAKQLRKKGWETMASDKPMDMQITDDRLLASETMKDKNGERIFDGDVAKVLQGKDKDIAYVGFENGAFMLYPKTGNIHERTLWEYWYNDWDVEVIGNITDNPELLEK